MEKLLAACGIRCYECPVYLATVQNDNIKRQLIAAEWSQYMDRELSVEDINCAGCHSENGVFFYHCTVCGIRKCASEKKIPNCAYCGNYPCSDLKKFHEKNKFFQAGENLDEIRIHQN